MQQRERDEAFVGGLTVGFSIGLLLCTAVVAVVLQKAEEVSASAYKSGKAVGCAQK